MVIGLVLIGGVLIPQASAELPGSCRKPDVAIVTGDADHKVGVEFNTSLSSNGREVRIDFLMGDEASPFDSWNRTLDDNATDLPVNLTHHASQAGPESMHWTVQNGTATSNRAELSLSRPCVTIVVHGPPDEEIDGPTLSLFWASFFLSGDACETAVIPVGPEEPGMCTRLTGHQPTRVPDGDSIHGWPVGFQVGSGHFSAVRNVVAAMKGIEPGIIHHAAESPVTVEPAILNFSTVYPPGFFADLDDESPSPLLADGRSASVIPDLHQRAVELKDAIGELRSIEKGRAAEEVRQAHTVARHAYDRFSEELKNNWTKKGSARDALIRALGEEVRAATLQPISPQLSQARFTGIITLLVAAAASGAGSWGILRRQGRRERVRTPFTKKGAGRTRRTALLFVVLGVALIAAFLLVGNGFDLLMFLGEGAP